MWAVLNSCAGVEGEGGNIGKRGECTSKHLCTLSIPKQRRERVIRLGDQYHYWQDVRRRAKEAKEAREAREAQAETFAPHPSDGGHVYTFVPGCPMPFTSVQQQNGKLHHLSGPSHTQQAGAADQAAIQKQRRRIQELGRVARAQKLKEDAAAADAALLARLKRDSPQHTVADEVAMHKQRRRIQQLGRVARAQKQLEEEAATAETALAAAEAALMARLKVRQH
ncbi:hypothetical protein B0H12DRAFT_1077306 [Mycena haematopus]|nr:hypothetical protein B0H12DRAFT_1077306 [Mycena haematopus]